MTQNGNEVNTIAPLQNVSLCNRVLERAMNRPAHLPGMVCFYGPSGYGKSFAASFVANRHRAYYIECKSTWTRKAILSAILHEMGIPPVGPIYALTEQISEQLALSGRPLIIDEMDHIVDRSAVEIVRDIYEGSGAAILLIGEEMLPVKLKRWERFHGRILDWAPAQPADTDDARTLARFYCHNISVRDDILEAVTRSARGSVRRVCVNLARIEEEALGMGLTEIGLAEWGPRKFFTGDAPARRLK
jgi:hypothetical protein